MSQQACSTIDNGQTQSQSLFLLPFRIINLIKLIENPGTLVFSNTDTSIVHFDGQHTLPMAAPDKNASRRRVANRIGNQVAQDLSCQNPVAFNDRRASCEFQTNTLCSASGWNSSFSSLNIFWMANEQTLVLIACPSNREISSRPSSKTAQRSGCLLRVLQHVPSFAGQLLFRCQLFQENHQRSHWLAQIMACGSKEAGF